MNTNIGTDINIHIMSEEVRFFYFTTFLRSNLGFFLSARFASIFHNNFTPFYLHANWTNNLKPKWNRRRKTKIRFVIPPKTFKPVFSAQLDKIFKKTELEPAFPGPGRTEPKN